MFFYYFPGLLKKNMKNLGVDMHKTNVQKFLSNILDSLANADENSKSLIFSYLCGYLTHYSMDYCAHPYVYYKAGFQVDGDKTSKLRYSVNHRRFETAIDVLMLKLMSGQKPSDKKLWQLIKADKEHAQVIAAMLSGAISSAYDRQISSKEVFNAIKYMVIFTRFLQSRRGYRKRFMELAEDLTIGEHLLSSIIHSQTVEDGIDYLNANKQPWHMPWDEKNEVTRSFAEMYNTAVLESERLIVNTYHFMDNVIDKNELLEIIGNKSLASGLEIEEDREFTIHGSVFA
jgi:hypothetical protein